MSDVWNRLEQYRDEAVREGRGGAVACLTNNEIKELIGTKNVVEDTVFMLRLALKYLPKKH